MRIDGAAAVVTGGASGLGEATVRRLAGAGAAVTILDRDDAKGEALAKELGGRARFAKADVTDPTEVKAAVDAATEGGPLRIAFSTAYRKMSWDNPKPNAPIDATSFQSVNCVA